jgi:hypothetical protein
VAAHVRGHRIDPRSGHESDTNPARHVVDAGDGIQQRTGRPRGGGKAATFGRLELLERLGRLLVLAGVRPVLVGLPQVLLGRVGCRRRVSGVGLPRRSHRPERGRDRRVRIVFPRVLTGLLLLAEGLVAVLGGAHLVGVDLPTRGTGPANGCDCQKRER